MLQRHLTKTHRNNPTRQVIHNFQVSTIKAWSARHLFLLTSEFYQVLVIHDSGQFKNALLSIETKAFEL